MARPRVKNEQTRKRIRALRGGAAAAGRGTVVVDTTGALLVWEHDHYPMYYVPRSDVAGRLEPAAEDDDAPGEASTAPTPDVFGAAQLHDLHTPDGDVLRGVIWSYPGVDALADHVRLDFDSFLWFEEDDPVLVHPRSPYVRVDCLRSSRHVRIEVEGQVIGNCTNPVMVYETGLSPRVYVPVTAMRLDLLTPSDTTSVCPYKGPASYHSLDLDGTILDDVCWTYPTPVVGAANIAGLLGLYHEKLEVYIDGKRHTGQN